MSLAIDRSLSDLDARAATPLPPDWFPELVGELSFAAASMTQMAARVGIAPPPLPALPGDPRDRIVWHLRQARFDLATVRGLSERLAARPEAPELGLGRVVQRLSGQFLASGVLHREAERNLPEALRRLSLYLAGFEHQLDDMLRAEAAPADAPTRAADDAAVEALIERAGGAWTLAEAAQRCGLASKQAMHARIKAGTAFGLMQGREYRLPRAQFIEEEQVAKPLAGLAPLIRLFRDWSSAGAPLLEFLISPTPHLDVTPREALRAGRGPAVLAAARTMLDVEDESPPPN